MSYSVSTGRVETSPVQNDSGSISVAILDHSTEFADESPFRQQQAGLGSRTATAAHSMVGNDFGGPLTRSVLPLPGELLGPKVAQHLLLSHHRTLTQPVMLATPLGQGVVANPLTNLVETLHGPVPHPPAAIPLRLQTRQRGRTLVKQ